MNIPQHLEKFDWYKPHLAWLGYEIDGVEPKRAVLSGADLNNTDLRRAILSGATLNGAVLNRTILSEATLSGADLRNAILSRAILNKTILFKADLRRAVLNETILFRADLSEAILNETILFRADLRRAVLFRAALYGADLKNTNLSGTVLNGADLRNTILDPSAKANANVEGFEKKGKFVFGYRPRGSGDIGDYLDGQIYSADFFSVCETDDHPGRYLWPTLEMAKYWDSSAEIIKVKAPIKHTHKAGSKWRCRWFEVIGKAEDK